MTSDLDPQHSLASSRLVGLPAPRMRLPWITYEDKDRREMLGPNAYTSLAELALKHPLIVYFYAVVGQSDPAADTLCNVFRDRDYTFLDMGLKTVGISTQTPLEQLEMASADLLPPHHLSDERLDLADDLDLPTKDVDGRDYYEPLIMVISNQRIEKVFFPVRSPRAEITQVISWAARNVERLAASSQSRRRDTTPE